MAEPMPKLYLVLHIGPLGFDYAAIRLMTEKPDPYYFTRGEGQAMVFEKVDGDYSTEFSAALRDGRVMQAVGERWHRVAFKLAAPPVATPGEEG